MMMNQMNMYLMIKNINKKIIDRIDLNQKRNNHKLIKKKDYKMMKNSKLKETFKIKNICKIKEKTMMKNNTNMKNLIKKYIRMNK